MRRSLSEAVLRVLEDPVSASWTARQVAEAVGCSVHLVAKIRRGRVREGQAAG